MSHMHNGHTVPDSHICTETFCLNTVRRTLRGNPKRKCGKHRFVWPRVTVIKVKASKVPFMSQQPRHEIWKF